VPNKRIIVDIETQSLVAYENGQEVFSWRISTGIGSAPTSPGIYQILNHDPEAYGSSFTLCGAQGCGQWTMYWFMGLYEVQPGLMNGFHGAVLLPNGSYLGGGNVGSPYTFGCVMSLDSNAKLLYDWADEGTPVEIISREFAPRSELGRRAFSA
jgi:lipoprotein-anchoring transpeptidase ErfK/SrfK